MATTSASRATARARASPTHPPPPRSCLMRNWPHYSRRSPMRCSVRLIGNVEPQTSAVRAALAGVEVCDDDPQLIVVAGWRHLIPPDVLAQPPLGVVGFHSAKLPAHPGRAPIYGTLLRGDERTYNTMLFLDAPVARGVLIDAASRRSSADATPVT